MPRNQLDKQRANKARYQAYKDLCVRHGVVPEWGRWWQHCVELRAIPDPGRVVRLPEAVVPGPRLTRAEHYAYWTERLTPKEIREVGGSLDFLDREAVAA
jgi:hypothetical protein